VPNPAAGNLLGNLVFWGSTRPGANGLRSLIDPNYKLFDPRLGIAYAPFKDTVVRAYYGIQHSPSFSIFNNGTTAPIYGVQNAVTPSTLNNGVTAAFNWNTGFPPPLPTPSTNPTFENGNSVEEVNPKINEVPYIQSFGLGVERALPWGLAAKGEYIGKMSHGLSTSPSVNQLSSKYFSLGSVLLDAIGSPQAIAAGVTAPYSGFTGSVAQALLPFPQYLTITDYSTTDGFSEYNAGHFALQKRFGTKGLSMLIDYTVSKDLVSGQFQGYMVDQEKALSSTDRPQSLAISYDYELPFGEGRQFLHTAHGLIRQVAGGWDVAGIHNYFKGGVINVTTQATIPGITHVWAVENPGVPIHTAVNCSNYRVGGTPYLNINAFSTPAPYTFGDVYTLPNVRSCGYENANMSVTKSFHIVEKVNFKFGGNFFNLLNQHSWTGLAANINSPTAFGTFSGATAPRVIQFSGRIEF
jgi:hypothetical protein